MNYLDTSLLVAALTNEDYSSHALAWLDAQDKDTLSISDWVITEFSSALSFKVRTGQLAAVDRATSLSLFSRLCAETLTIFPVDPPEFRTAARFIDSFALSLRSADALHLAVAGARASTLCTLDRRLANAGPVVGVPTLLV